MKHEVNRANPLTVDQLLEMYEKYAENLIKIENVKKNI